MQRKRRNTCGMSQRVYDSACICGLMAALGAGALLGWGILELIERVCT